MINKQIMSDITNKKNMMTIFVFIIMYLSSSMFMDYAISYTIRIMAILLISVMILIYKNRKINKVSTICLLTLLSMQCISVMAHGVNLGLNIGSFIMLLAAYLVSSIIPFKNFMHSYRKIMFFLCSFSLIVYVLYLLAPGIFSIFPDKVWHIGITFKNLYFTTIPVSMSDYYRNFGIFEEPGVYQIYINYALMIELFFIKKPNIKYIIVYIATLITTISTNGYVVIAILLLAYLVKENKGSDEEQKYIKRLKILICVAFFIGLVVFQMLPGYYQAAFTKFTEMSGNVNNVSGSGDERLRAIVYSWNAYKDNLSLGIGYTGMQESFSNIIMTCTPLNWFLIYGGIYGILCNVLYLNHISFAKDRLIVKILLGISLIALIVSQEMSATMFCDLLIFYGASMINVKSIKESELQL